VALAFISVSVFLWSIEYAQEQTIRSVGERIAAGIFNETGTDPAALAGEVGQVKERAYAVAFVALIALYVLFGFIIARFALWPTRNSLQFQKRFIGNIAHEIRTPLAIIKTNTEVALFDEKLPADVRETFTDTLTELDRISETINNLLSFDTLTRPRRMQLEPTDLAAIAETALRRHQEFADSRGVSLVSDMGTACLVQGSAVALEQVATNLIKNAITYTPKDQSGTVTVLVGASDVPGRIRLSVRDTGIGIEQKDLFHIFEPFYRADTSRARGIGTGTSGLGLAIVNEIVRLHKGAIAIRSTPGEGTEITVTLPVAKGTDLPDPLVDGSKGTNEVSVDFS